MIAVLVIAVLLIAGFVAWGSERINPALPRWITLVTFIVATVFLGFVWISAPSRD